MSPLQPEIVWTIVVAGGSGARFGGPKQYALIDGRRMIDMSIDVARIASDGVVVVLPAMDVDGAAAAAEHAGSTFDGLIVVAGGSSRSESVRAGLAVVPPDATVVCIHDAARPFASAGLFSAVISAVSVSELSGAELSVSELSGADGAVPGVPVTDTIKVVDADGGVVSTPDRATLVAVQTPQAFRAASLRSAHAGGGDGTDDAALVERMGGRVVVVKGAVVNRKITDADDLAWAQGRS